MSLARACLRLAAVAALRDQTFAGPRVFDSRIGPLDTLAPEGVGAVITVWTEQDDGPALSSQNGGTPFRPTVDLVIELQMVIAGTSEGGTFSIGNPETDRELEASLDTLEARVVEVLLDDVSIANAELFRRAFIRANSRSSVRFVEPTDGTRLAVRYLTIKFEVPDNPRTDYVGTETGLDRLPEPFRTVAKGWADGTPEKAVATAIAAQLGQPTLPILSTLVATYAFRETEREAPIEDLDTAPVVPTPIITPPFETETDPYVNDQGSPGSPG